MPPWGIVALVGALRDLAGLAEFRRLTASKPLWEMCCTEVSCGVLPVLASRAGQVRPVDGIPDDVAAYARTPERPPNNFSQARPRAWARRLGWVGHVRN